MYLILSRHAFFHRLFTVRHHTSDLPGACNVVATVTDGTLTWVNQPQKEAPGLTELVYRTVEGLQNETRTFPWVDESGYLTDPSGNYTASTTYSKPFYYGRYRADDIDTIDPIPTTDQIRNILRRFNASMPGQYAIITKTHEDFVGLAARIVYHHTISMESTLAIKELATLLVHVEHGDTDTLNELRLIGAAKLSS